MSAEQSATYLLHEGDGAFEHVSDDGSEYSCRARWFPFEASVQRGKWIASGKFVWELRFIGTYGMAGSIASGEASARSEALVALSAAKDQALGELRQQLFPEGRS